MEYDAEIIEKKVQDGVCFVTVLFKNNQDKFEKTYRLDNIPAEAHTWFERRVQDELNRLNLMVERVQEIRKKKIKYVAPPPAVVEEPPVVDDTGV